MTILAFRLEVSREILAGLYEHLQKTYVMGHLRLVKRIHAILYIVEGKGVAEVANMLNLSVQTLYNYLKAFLLHQLKSLLYRHSPGRPAKLNAAQRKELGKTIDAGPEIAGYDCGCWSTTLIQDWIFNRFGVEYAPRYVADLLDQMGFSYQRARFVPDHLGDVAAEQEGWMSKTWPEILRLAEEKAAMILFGDEASFAQWGSLSYTWARKGQQPTVKTSGIRKAYKIIGLIDFLSGAFFYKAHTGRFNSETYQAFLLEVLAKTSQHLIIIQDGARYHPSKDMQEFFAEHAKRIRPYQLPRYSPNYNSIEYLWRNVKKQATHLRYFETFADLTQKVDEKLAYFATLPKAILGLMGKYLPSLGTLADSSEIAL
jgi:transposase